MPLVSVILPTRDRPELLPRAVASVLAQTEADLELLIIDNNRRESPVRGEKWSADTRVKVVSAPEAASAAAARNAGLHAAQGTWISYLDDDDAYRPEKLERQLQLAESTGAGVVLCGAEFHLQGRSREVQCDRPRWQGDELILKARWNTPLLFHRRRVGQRFDETLSPGEDAEFAHRLLAEAGMKAVPVETQVLVDIYPQAGPRVNRNSKPLRAATARILGLRPGFYSRSARRRFILQALLAQAKLQGRMASSASLGVRLLRESRGADWRAAANALAVSSGLFPGRWVS